MIESKVDELLKFWDNIFMEERVEVDGRGYYGSHYMGLCLDEYFSNSIYDIDYLSIEDYFDAEAGVSYNERQGLYAQYINVFLLSFLHSIIFVSFRSVVLESTPLRFAREDYYLQNYSLR